MQTFFFPKEPVSVRVRKIMCIKNIDGEHIFLRNFIRRCQQIPNTKCTKNVVYLMKNTIHTYTDKL